MERDERELEAEPAEQDRDGEDQHRPALGIAPRRRDRVGSEGRVAGRREPQGTSQHEQGEGRDRGDEEGERPVRGGAGSAQRDQRDQRHGRELEGDEPGADVTRRGDPSTARRSRQEERRRHGRVTRAATGVMEQGERRRPGEQDAGLQRAGGRAGGPQACAVGRREAQGPQRLGCRSQTGGQRGTGCDEKHRHPEERRPTPPPREQGVTDEDEDRCQGGEQRRREDDGVDADEGRIGHRAPPIRATASAVTASSGPGSTPRTTTPSARVVSTTASTPRVSRVVPASGSGTSPTQTRRATRSA